MDFCCFDIVVYLKLFAEEGFFDEGCDSCRRCVVV